MIDEIGIRARFEAVRGQLDERGVRLVAASEVRAAGRGGLDAVSRVTGLARSTIGRGLKDLDRPRLEAGRVRRPGSGRLALCERDPALLEDLRKLLEPATRGDPMRPLMWVSKSFGKLAAGLVELGHSVCPNTVGKLISMLGYSRQGNRKTLEGRQHADRDAQFRHINARAQAAQAGGHPVISVDLRKKNLSAASRTMAPTIARRASPRRSTRTIFPTRKRARWCLTGSTT